MTSTSKRLEHSTRISIQDYISMDVSDSGVITISGEELEDWRENDFYLIKGTIASLGTPNHLNAPTSSSTPNGYETSTQNDMFSELDTPNSTDIANDIDIGEDSIIFFLNRDTHTIVQNTQTDVEQPGISQSILQPTTIPETQQDPELIQPQQHEQITSQPEEGELLLSAITPTQANPPPTSEKSEPPKTSNIANPSPNLEIQNQNKKLRSRVISLEKQLEEVNAKYTQHFSDLNARLNDLQSRLNASDKQREDDTTANKLLHNEEIRDISTKLELYEQNEKHHITTIQGLKADLSTQHRKNTVLVQKLQNMGCDIFNNSLPQSMTPPSKPTCTKAEPLRDQLYGNFCAEQRLQIHQHK
ncbi:unnamed protein product [Owenia fusiformis]|uniref:Uncharacterized protein n=1 Tax=Owenia fusiformis TaxID=6347 RepID=A0A8S4PMN3_OWEFU|nr:unnamed protein product [Owenia fusiformis]